MRSRDWGLKPKITASLGRRLSLSLLAYSIGGLTAILLLLSFVVDQRFSRLEDQEITSHVDRSQAMLDAAKQTIESRALDWAIWDDSFGYLHARDKAFETANLNNSSFANMDVSAMGFVRFDGAFSRALYFDPATGEPDARTAADIKRRIAGPQFVEMMRAADRKAGFLRVGDRIFTVAAAKIFKSDGSGVSEGFIVMGKELKGTDIARSLQLPARLDMVPSTARLHIVRGGDAIAIARRIDGFAGEPVATVHLSFPRSIQREGRALLWIIAGGVAVLLLAMVSLLNWRLRSMLIRPVAAFQKHVALISSSGELAHFKEDARADELGSLYREFNLMADELNNLRAKVEAQSFAIGKNDSAIGIMHNVRNAISPVQAILSKLDDSMHLPAQANLQRALAELKNDASLPERQGKLIAFVDAAVTQSAENVARYRGDIREALRSVGHVVEAINTAQSGGESLGLAPADCDLSATIGSSSAIVRHSRAAQVSVQFETDERFRIALPRVLFAQIVDNVLINAVEAVAATGRGRGEITIAATRDAQAPRRFVQVIIRDDGDGFAPDDATGLFERGRSSRKQGHGGIGLHWCANTLNAVGGSMAINSAGIGQGATVTLIVPLALTEADVINEEPVADAA